MWRDDPAIYYGYASFRVSHFYTVDTNPNSPSHPVSIYVWRANPFSLLALVILGTAISTLRLYMRVRRLEKRQEADEIFEELFTFGEQPMH